MGSNIRKNLDLYNLIAHKPSFNSVITYFTLLVKKLSSIGMPKYLIVTNNNNKKPTPRKWKWENENLSLKIYYSDSSFLQFENFFAGPLTYIPRVWLFKYEEYKLAQV